MTYNSKPSAPEKNFSRLAILLCSIRKTRNVCQCALWRIVSHSQKRFESSENEENCCQNSFHYNYELFQEFVQLVEANFFNDSWIHWTWWKFILEASFREVLCCFTLIVPLPSLQIASAICGAYIDFVRAQQSASSSRNSSDLTKKQYCATLGICFIHYFFASVSLDLPFTMEQTEVLTKNFKLPSNLYGMLGVSLGRPANFQIQCHLNSKGFQNILNFLSFGC